MRPVGRGIEVSVLGERILKSGAKKHSLEIRCLTVYDMCKAVQRDMRIDGIHLLYKEGGKSGVYEAEE